MIHAQVNQATLGLVVLDNASVAMEATAVDDPRSAAKKRWIRRWRISESDDDDDDVEEEKQIEISLCRCRCHDRKRGDAQMIEV